MADRVVRDEMLRSERYWSVNIEEQRLFVHLLLNADSYGRFSGKNYTVRAACFPGQAVEPSKIEKMLSDLNDADLIRLYEVDGERFIFIPRFKQRLRYKLPSKYPEPPPEINDLPIQKPDLSQERDRIKTGSSPQKRREVKRSKPLAQTAFARFWAVYPKRKSKGQAERAFFSISPDEQLLQTILSAVERAKTTEEWTKQRGKYVPHPASWLSAKGWEDELEVEQPMNGLVL